MYHLGKTIANKILSKHQMFRYELFMRNIVSFFYSGDSHECNLCKKKLRIFTRLHNGDLLCPACGSLSRDRRLWHLLHEGYLNSGIKVLDFSPSRCLARKMKDLMQTEYISSDLSGNFLADYHYDITALDIPDSSINLIICYHILEHIDDDAAAMKELFRVLKPEGKALVQTPFKEGDIYENIAITTSKDRLMHFGQEDHVRVYSSLGLTERLEAVGFTVEAQVFDGDGYYGFTENEIVLHLTKPLL